MTKRAVGDFFDRLDPLACAELHRFRCAPCPRCGCWVTPHDCKPQVEGMRVKLIRYFGEEKVLACDGKCDKAWGINGRPKRQLSEDGDDYVFIGDGEFGEALAPGPGETVAIAEGCDIKPENSDGFGNKWCTRECERTAMVDLGEPIDLPDMTNPEPNIPRKAS